AARGKRVVTRACWANEADGPLSAGCSLEDEVAGLDLDEGAVRLEDHAERVAPGPDGLDLLAEQAAEHHHAAVAGREALLRVQRDRALSYLRLVVVGHPLVLFFGQLGPPLADEADAGDPLAPGGPIKRENLRRRVIDGQRPGHGVGPAVPLH